MGLFSKKREKEYYDFIEAIINSASSQLGIRKAAINKAIDLLSKVLSACQLDVYKIKNKKITKVKGELFYKLNVRPNANDYGYNFWYKVWEKYFNDGEVLLFSLNNKLYMAEDFTVNDNVIAEREYRNISLISENNYTFRINKSFKASEVIHLKLSNNDIKTCLEEYYSDLGNLLSIASDYFKSNNVMKWILGTPGGQQPLRDAKTGKEISYEDYKAKIVGSIFSKKDSVTLLSKSFSLENVSSNKNVSSEDFRNLKKDWGESVADTFLIPRDIYFGNKSEKSSSDEDFFSYAINPHLKLLENALNAVVIKKDDFIKGEKIRANIHTAKVHDIISNANSLDKLYSDGFSHNDILGFLNLELIDEEWANEHRITKNYSEDVSVKGGDNSG